LANGIYLPVTEDYWTPESASDHEDIDIGSDSKSARAAQSKHATSDVVKTTSRGTASAKPVAKSAPSLKGKKKSGQQTLAGFFKK